MNMPILETEFAKLEQAKNSDTTNVGMFSIKSANQTLQEAAQRPNPTPLWLTLWNEGEVCCLFADGNVGKSIYAVQIANEIAAKQKVLYFDFELSDKQFQLRYTDENTNKLFIFSNNLYRVEIDRDKFDITTDFESAIIANIERAAIETEAKILIIDNLTYLCLASEKGDAAGVLMMRLMQLKRKYNLSILVIAHTPKRPLSNPITQNDLAGSKKLYNFFDSVFSIGTSAKDSDLRYVKQIKCRAGEFKYGADNVIVCKIENENAFLKLTIVGYATEKEHLREPTDEDLTAEIDNVGQLASEGKSIREIANILNISKSKVGRILKKNKSVPMSPMSHTWDSGTEGQPKSEVQNV